MNKSWRLSHKPCSTILNTLQFCNILKGYMLLMLNRNHTYLIGKQILPIYLIKEYARHGHSISNMVQQTTISCTEILIYTYEQYKTDFSRKCKNHYYNTDIYIYIHIYIYIYIHIYIYICVCVCVVCVCVCVYVCVVSVCVCVYIYIYIYIYMCV